jgi:hypothetical protein
MIPIRTERIGDKTVPVLIWPDGSWIHLMAHDIDGGQKPAEQLERWLKAWRASPAPASVAQIQAQAKSAAIELADQPAEPSERELPTHWGHWVRNGEHYWVYGKGPIFHIQRLNVETGLPHEDTADFAITLNSAGLRGHWRPAVPDDDAALCWECPDCGYKMHRDHYDERLTDAQNCSACEILRLHSERDRLRERLEAVVLMAEASELYDIASVAKGC